jgi:hypothetical protein
LRCKRAGHRQRQPRFGNTDYFVRAGTGFQILPDHGLITAKPSLKIFAAQYGDRRFTGFVITGKYQAAGLGACAKRGKYRGRYYRKPSHVGTASIGHN